MKNQNIAVTLFLQKVLFGFVEFEFWFWRSPMHIYKQSPINTVHTTIILSLECVRTMSDEQEQLMQQLQQKQQIIKELKLELEKKQLNIKKVTQELVVQKKKSSVNQKVNMKQESNSKPNFYSRFLTCLKSFFSEKPQPSLSKQPEKITCPQGHSAYKIHFDHRLCNKCSQKRYGGRICSKCSYSLCSKCKAVKHSVYCSKKNCYIYRNLQVCKICSSKLRGGTKCRKCSYMICRRCKPVSHENFCPDVKVCQYVYHADDQVCFKCSSIQVGGKSCRKCEFNICNRCE